MSCYKCSGLERNSKICNKKNSCCKCSKEHMSKICKEKNVKCINCNNSNLLIFSYLLLIMIAIIVQQIISAVFTNYENGPLL